MESLARPVYTTARAANSKPQAGPVRAGPGESTTYAMWIQEKQFMLVPASAYVAKAVASFKEFPPRGSAGELLAVRSTEVDGERERRTTMITFMRSELRA